MIDLMNDLGEPWTPMVLRFRTDTLEACILTTHANTEKHGLDLIVSVGPSLLTAREDFRIFSPYRSDPGP